MPQISRYSDEQVEQLLAELLNVLEKHKAPTDLSLMVLGNMVTNLINTSIVTNLINTSIAPAQRHQHQHCPGPTPGNCQLSIANSFARALQSSINEDKTKTKRTKGNR